MLSQVFRMTAECVRTVARIAPNSCLARQLAVALGCFFQAATFSMTHADDGELRLQQTDSAITILDDRGSVLVYNKTSPPVPDGIDDVYARSGFLHPVATPAGNVVTALFPPDHAHQNGIFSAWVNTTWNGRNVDFWNVAKNSGRVIHDKVVSTHNNDKSVGFAVDLIHQAVAEETVNILKERWEISVFRTDRSYRCFDLSTKQSALTDKPLIVNKYHYGGMALRGLSRWVLSGKQTEGRLADTGFLNNLGSDRIAGNHQKSKWVSLYGTIDEQPVSITVLCHPDNFRAPQAARLHPTKPYFCFAPCVAGEFSIDKEHPYTARYRYLVTDDAPQTEWLNEQWATWVGAE